MSNVFLCKMFYALTEVQVGNLQLLQRNRFHFFFFFFFQNKLHTVIFLSFRTDRSGQTVQTQIRLLSLIWVYTVCHSVCIVWTHYSMVEPHISNFRVIITICFGVRIFRKFTVLKMDF